MTRGYFIVFEGIDRVGKSTQINLLQDFLVSKGRKVETIRFPNRSGVIGGLLDKFLSGEMKFSRETAHMLFTADKFDSAFRICERLQSGVDVLCDRYVYSGIAYQVAQGLSMDFCIASQAGLPEPDMVCFLKASATMCSQKPSYGKELYEDLELQKKVAQTYAELSKLPCISKSWHEISAEGEKSETAKLVIQAFEKMDQSTKPKLGSIGKLFDGLKVQYCNSSSAACSFTQAGSCPTAQSKAGPGSPKSPKCPAVEEKSYTPIESLGESLKDQTVWVRGRVEVIRSKSTKLAFLRLRGHNCETVQAVCNNPEIVAKIVSGITPESVVDLQGTVQVPPAPIQSATKSGVELKVTQVDLVTKADTVPVTQEDLNRPFSESSAAPVVGASTGTAAATSSAEAPVVKVALETRLSNRILDLRTAANQGIFRVQSAVCQVFREYMSGRGFIEIHTPKLVATASEGGANVFKVQYFERFAYLAQSPQFYKQMGVMADFPGVFEIAPVFRAENSLTHRHMTEFTGLDLEMPIKRSYMEILDFMDGFFNALFHRLETPELAKYVAAITKQFPGQDKLQWTYPCLKMTFEEAVNLLKAKGPALVTADMEAFRAAGDSFRVEECRKHLESIKAHGVMEDLGTSDEKLLGRIVKAQHATDFYMIHRFPSAIRAFYTMPCGRYWSSDSDSHDNLPAPLSEADTIDSKWSRSYDIYIRGEEIVSGAQRLHNPAKLVEHAKDLGVDLSPVQDYIDCFKYGAYPHGGAGIGLERVVMLYLGLNNIRLCSMFPRDPKRLTP